MTWWGWALVSVVGHLVVWAGLARVNYARDWTQAYESKYQELSVNTAVYREAAAVKHADTTARSAALLWGLWPVVVIISPAWLVTATWNWWISGPHRKRVRAAQALRDDYARWAAIAADPDWHSARERELAPAMMEVAVDGLRALGYAPEIQRVSSEVTPGGRQRSHPSECRCVVCNRRRVAAIASQSEP